MQDGKIIVAYIGNGKSTNRYHIPFVLTRKNKFKIKSIYNPRVHHDVWPAVEGVIYTEHIDDVYHDPEVDLVVVSTRQSLHYPYVKRALESGKHCLCEKPFMETAEEAREVFALAEEKGLYCSAYQNRRYDSDFLTMQKVVEEGKLGGLLEVEMHYDYYRPEVPNGVEGFTKSSS